MLENCPKGNTYLQNLAVENNCFFSLLLRQDSYYNLLINTYLLSLEIVIVRNKLSKNTNNFRYFELTSFKISM